MARGRLEVIVLPDTAYQIQHQTLSGDWFLQSQQDNDSQEPFAQAHEPNPLQRLFEITYGDEQLILTAIFPFRRAFEIRENGRVLGQI